MRLSPFLREKFRVQLEPPRMLAIASNLPRITQPWPLMKLLQSLALPKFQTAACNVDAHANIPAQFLTVLCTQLCVRVHMYLSLTLTVKLSRNQPVHWQMTICLFWNLCWDRFWDGFCIMIILRHTYYFQFLGGGTLLSPKGVSNL